jgi:hypothetical protein
MKVKSLVAGCALVLGVNALPSVSLADDLAIGVSGNASVAREQIQQILERQRQLDMLSAPIHSESDLVKYDEKTDASQNPLNSLSQAARGRFLKSLVFSEKGLASFGEADLKTELSASQVYRILSLFGVQSSTQLVQGLRMENDVDRAIMSKASIIPYTMPGGADGYRCADVASGEPAHTCFNFPQAICTANC